MRLGLRPSLRTIGATIKLEVKDGSKTYRRRTGPNGRVFISPGRAGQLSGSGGGCRDSGLAVVIAGAKGERKRPLFIRRREPLTCDKHTLVPLSPGDFVIIAKRDRADYDVRVLRAASIDEDQVTTEEVARLRDGRWSPEPPRFLTPAITSAMTKAKCHHCQRAHYVAGGGQVLAKEV